MKKLYKLLYALPVMLILFVATSCVNGNSIKSISIRDNYAKDILIGSFNPSDYEIVITTMNGNEKTVKVTEDMIDLTERSKYYTIGEHEIIVNYDGEQLKIVVNVIRNKTFDAYFNTNSHDGENQYTCYYDGKPHGLEIVGYYPADTEIYYPLGNSFTEAGEYEIEARLSHYNYEPMTITGTLVIEKNWYDCELKLNDLKVTYDGESHEISVVGDLPDEVSVSYTIKDEKNIETIGNSATDAGVYTVTANFTSANPNFEELDSLIATLTIEKATFDVDTLSIGEQSVKYTGSDIEWELTNNLPTWITVKYVNYVNIDSDKVVKTDAGYYVKTKKGEGDYKLNEKDELILSANGDYVFAGTDLYSENDFGIFEPNDQGKYVMVKLSYYAQSEKGYHTISIELIVNNENYNKIKDYKVFEIFIYEG